MTENDDWTKLQIGHAFAAYGTDEVGRYLL